MDKKDTVVTVLVTGAKGQLGSEINELVTADFHKDDSVSFVFTDIEELDICEIGRIREFVKKHRITHIVNCAAYTAVDLAETDSESAYRINRDAAKNLAIVSNENNILMIHISTDFVYDGEKSTPYVESDIPNPFSVYGQSKLDGENAVLESARNSIIIRTSWLYSGFGNNFVKTMMRLGLERESLGVVFDQIGSPTYAKDLAKAILVIIDKSKAENDITESIFHFSNEGVTSWYDFACSIMKLSNIECSVKAINSFEYPTPAKRPDFSVLDKRKIKDTFKIHIPHWQNSLEECIRKIQTCEIAKC